MKSLNPYSNGLPSRGCLRMTLRTNCSVLIPILMDYPLGVKEVCFPVYIIGCLNPYSNGLPSRGGETYGYTITEEEES